MDAISLLKNARNGADECLGPLLQLYRNYLRLLADSQLDRKLRARVGPSDIVQETLLAAHRDFTQFCGTSESEFLAWLRQILSRNMAHATRDFTRDKRDVRRERQCRHPSRRAA